MSTTWRASELPYCDQGGATLAQFSARELKTLQFQNAKRIQTNLLAAGEKRALLWMAARLPAWVSPDHLTLLGFAAQLLVGCSYALSGKYEWALLLASFFIVVNWFGDSLDGTLARYRNRQRPRYGFYVDHVIDSFGATFLCAGLALSGYMTPLIALALLIAFLLLSIEVYLATYTLGDFQLSFWNLGPTEMRIVLIVGNLALFVRGPWAHLAGHSYKLFDVGAAVAIAAFAVMTTLAAVKHTAQLYHEETLR